MSDEHEMRRMIVYVTDKLLCEALTTGNRFDGLLVSKGLPPGAKFVGPVHRPSRGSLGLCFEHPSFKPVPEGHEVMELRVELTRETQPEED